MPQIRVSDQVKKRLDEIKKRNGHTSSDSVIRYLLMKAGEIPTGEVFTGVCEFEASGYMCHLKELKERCDGERSTCQLRRDELEKRVTP